MGFSLNKGFGFIQYHEVSSAQNAFKAQSPLIAGRRLVVKPAANSSWGAEAIAKQSTTAPEPTNNSKPRLPKIWSTGAHVPLVGTLNLHSSRPLPQPPMPTTNGNAAAFEATNDCEIIVMSRALTTYAESLETRLRSLGMTVDLLFPNSEVPLGKVLSNISSRGCLYAILVTPLNEEHRSISVNILYGQPAEHRNMPVDDAITFIDKNFTSYRQEQRRGGGAPLDVVMPHRHSDAIQQLLLALAENRPLTVLQYDTIVQYLQERREAQIKEELGDAAAAMMLPEKTEEQKLQEKIMSILDKPTMTENMKSIEVETSDMVLSDGLEILLDPKVQRALDSLLKSCIAYK